MWDKLWQHITSAATKVATDKLFDSSKYTKSLPTAGNILRNSKFVGKKAVLEADLKPLKSERNEVVEQLVGLAFRKALDPEKVSASRAKGLMKSYFG